MDTPSFLALIDDRGWLVAPEGTDISSAIECGIEVECYRAYDPTTFVDPQSEAVAVMSRLIHRLPWRSVVGVETQLLAVELGDALGLVERADLAEAIAAWRVRRDPTEIAAVRAAVNVVDRALESAAALVRPGITERELFEAATEALRAEVHGSLKIGGNLASGGRTCLDGPLPTDRRLGRGDLVLLDLYPEVDGYVADLCRTWVVGEPSLTQRIRHEAVEKALQAAKAIMRPGVIGKDIDAVLRASMCEIVGPLGSSMSHHGGHGVGLFAWERPWIGSASQDRLTEGSIIAIEPGIYEPGWGGIRIESNFLVTDVGVEQLDSSPRSLTRGA